MGSQIQPLLLDVDRSLNGDAWHGPSLREALDGVTYERAVAHPLPGSHSIADLVWHIAAWIEEVSARLRGEFHDDPLRGNFPPTQPRDATEWEAWTTLPVAALAELRDAAAAFPDERLHQAITPSNYSGRTPTYWETLGGIAQHNAYHAGQIVLLNRMSSAG